MKEIELKVLDVDPKEIERKVKRLGGKKFGTVKVVAFHYDFPDGRIKARHEIMRLRTNGKLIELTYKKKGSGTDERVKESHEMEVNVSDFKTMEEILLSLGLIATNKTEKTRTSFKLGKVKVEIDKHPGVPAYIEIEGSRSEILKALKRLGYSLSDATSMTAGQVLKLYGIDTRIKS